MRIVMIFSLLMLSLQAGGVLAGSHTMASVTIEALSVGKTAVTVTLSEAAPDCLFDQPSITNVDTAAGQSLYSAALMAKSSGGLVTVIYDTLGAPNYGCDITLIVVK